MTRAQRIAALRYVSRQLPAAQVPGNLLRHVRSPEPVRQQRSSPARPSRWDYSARRAEKLPDGRIITVRNRSQPPRERHLTAIVIILTAALAGSIFFFLSQWSPAFQPTDVVILRATTAAAGARAALLTENGRMMLVAEDLPTPAPGFRYVAWRRTTDGWVRAGTLLSVGTSAYRLNAPIGTNEQVEVSIERVGGDTDARGPVMLEGLTSQ